MAWAHYQRGLAYEAQGDLDRARSVLEEVQDIAPGDIRILRQLAFVAGESGDTAEAIAAYEELTAAATAAIEAQIRAYPEQWVWMHRRWRTRPQEETRPDLQ